MFEKCSRADYRDWMAKGPSVRGQGVRLGLCSGAKAEHPALCLTTVLAGLQKIFWPYGVIL